MKNLILALTGDSIPYVRHLNILTGSIVGSILMQQLDFHFRSKPDGFWKFLHPSPSHPQYKAGDSWMEELEISKFEFRNAFDKIGVRYSDLSKFKAAGADAFQGKFYASYVDRRNNLTYYVRNHELLDQCLYEVFRSKKPAGVATSQDMPHLSGLNNAPKTADYAPVEVPSTVKVKTSAVASPDAVNSSPATPATSLVQTEERASAAELDELIYPALPEDELAGVRAEVAACPAQWRQAVLDEVEGKRVHDGFKRTAASFLHALVKAAQEDEFKPNLATAVQRARREAGKHKASLSKVIASPTATTLHTMTPEEIDMLPKHLREHVMEAKKNRLQGSEADTSLLLN